jgi:hypothetical protein
LPLPCAYATNERMDDAPITIRKYTDFDEIKADEYRYWQSRPIWERVAAVSELTLDGYALKGIQPEPDVPRSKRPFIRLQCPWR